MLAHAPRSVHVVFDDVGARRLAQRGSLERHRRVGARGRTDCRPRRPDDPPCAPVCGAARTASAGASSRATGTSNTVCSPSPSGREATAALRARRRRAAHVDRPRAPHAVLPRAARRGRHRPLRPRGARDHREDARAARRAGRLLRTARGVRRRRAASCTPPRRAPATCSSSRSRSSSPSPQAPRPRSRRSRPVLLPVAGAASLALLAGPTLAGHALDPSEPRLSRRARGSAASRVGGGVGRRPARTRSRRPAHGSGSRDTRAGNPPCFRARARRGRAARRERRCTSGDGAVSRVAALVDVVRTGDPGEVGALPGAARRSGYVSRTAAAARALRARPVAAVVVAVGGADRAASRERTRPYERLGHVALARRVWPLRSSSRGSTAHPRRRRAPAAAPAPRCERRDAANGGDRARGADTPPSANDRSLREALGVVHATIVLVRLTTLGDLLLDVIVRLDAPLAPGDDRAAHDDRRAGRPGGERRGLGGGARRGRPVRRQARRRRRRRARRRASCARTGSRSSGRSPGGRASSSRSPRPATARWRPTAARRPTSSPDELDEAWFDCDVLHVSGYALLREPIAAAALAAARLARAPRRAGVARPLVVDARRRRRSEQRVLELAPDIVFANEAEQRGGRRARDATGC